MRNRKRVFKGVVEGWACEWEDDVAVIGKVGKRYIININKFFFWDRKNNKFLIEKKILSLL